MYIIRILCLLLFSLNLNAQEDSFEQTSCVFETFQDYWKCINESDVTNKKFRRNHLFYFQAARGADGYEIILFKGEMDSFIKEVIEDTLNCAASRSQLSNDVKFIFFHDHNEKSMTSEIYDQQIEQFKREHNIARNICEYRIGSGYRI